MDHVLIRALSEHLLLVRVLYIVELVLSVAEARRLPVDLILNVVFVILSLLKLTLRRKTKQISGDRLLLTYLFGLQLLFLGENGFVALVVLVADPTQRGADFFVLFVAELPRGNDIVGLKEGVAWHKAVLCTPVIIPISAHLNMVSYMRIPS